MRHLLVVALVAGLLLAAPAALRAQGKFSLEYQDAEAPDLLLSSNMLYRASKEPPAEMKVAPKGLSGDVWYHSIPVGNRKVLAILDNSSSPRLFVDAAGTGDLSTAQPLAGPVVGSWRMFGPVSVTAGGPNGQRTIRVRFACHVQRPIGMKVQPAGYRMGEVRLGGHSYRVAVADLNVDGRYDNVFHISKDQFSPMRETLLCIDLNHDGRFESTNETDEAMPLFPGLHVKDLYYSVNVAPDGSSITLARVEPDCGTLDAGCPDLSLKLWSESGLHLLSGSQGKWRLPAGWYWVMTHCLSRTDAAKTPWQVIGQSRFGPIRMFEVRAGETSAIQVGPPLALKVQPAPLAEGVIDIGIFIQGRGGEGYSASVTQNGVLRQSHTLRILDEAGKVLATGKFEFG